MLCDALIWTDELPPMRSLARVPHWSIIRALFAYRSGLILGEPDEALREFWDEALRLFPGWPGFDPDRRSSRFGPLLQESQVAVGAELEEIEREMDREAESG